MFTTKTVRIKELINNKFVHQYPKICDTKLPILTKISLAHKILMSVLTFFITPILSVVYLLFDFLHQYIMLNMEFLQMNALIKILNVYICYTQYTFYIDTPILSLITLILFIRSILIAMLYSIIGICITFKIYI